MKLIGKVGDQVTYLDSSSMKGNCLLTYSIIFFKENFTFSKKINL
jgi:hypothetical protein